MNTERQQHFIKRIKWFLQALAQTAEVQVGLFDEFGKQFETTPEQLASGFNECVAFFKSEKIELMDLSSLIALDDFLYSISNEEHYDLWDESALYHAREWSLIREDAKKILMDAGWSQDIPNAEDEVVTYIVLPSKKK